MGSTGDLRVGQADPAVLPALMRPPASIEEHHVEDQVATFRAIAGPHFDEDAERALAALGWQRGHNPHAIAFQLAAILASGDRTPMLRSLACPTLVVHGLLDPLVALSGGEATAAAVPGARLVVFDDMGHDLPRPRWPALLDELASLRAASVG
jgi:pimeloyl-ACP methyl ester carboxylesterase